MQIPCISLQKSTPRKVCYLACRLLSYNIIGKIILADLVALLKPKYLEVEVRCTPRERLKARTFANYAKPRSRYEEMAKARMAAFRASLRAAPKIEELPEECITLGV